MAKEFWTNSLGSEMWVVDTNRLPPWQNLQTGESADLKPSSVDRKFTPSGPFTQEDAQLFPYASQHISGFPSATGPRAVSQPSLGETLGPPASLAAPPEPEGTDSFSFLTVDQLREIIFSTESTPEEVRRASAILAAGGGATDGGGAGRTGPTAAELAIQRSQVQAQNLATFISGTVAELEIEVDARRLSTEQAIGEFNRRLDAFSEAGKQFREIQPFTIPIGAEYAPGFGPGEIGEQLGIAPRRAEVVQFDPFAEASQIVADTPVLTDIGVPSTDALQQAIETAKGFL